LRSVAAWGAQPTQAELDVNAAGTDVSLRHYEEAAAGGTGAFVVGFEAEGGVLRLVPEEGVVAEEGVAVDGAAFGAPTGHGEEAPLGTETEAGEVESVRLPVGLAAGDLADALPAVDELLLPGAGEGALEGGFVSLDAQVFDGQLEFEAVSFGKGVFDFGGPLDGSVGLVTNEGIDFEFAAFGAEGADEVEDERLRNAGADAGERSFIGVLSGERRDGEETHC